MKAKYADEVIISILVEINMESKAEQTEKHSTNKYHLCRDNNKGKIIEGK